MVVCPHPAPPTHKRWYSSAPVEFVEISALDSFPATRFWLSAAW
jgi:hypothetical protein